MLLSHSAWRRLLVTAGTVTGIVIAYQATMLDSQHAARQALSNEASAEPSPGTRLRFTATAYCKGNLTASGVVPRSRIAAADPDLLPVGSVIQIGSDDQRYSGIYTIMDTGPMVQGRHIDIYMWSCNEALQFGRRPVHVTVLRLGWHPRATLPRMLDALLPWRDRPAPPPAPLPSRPIAPPDAAPPPLSTKPAR
ncbi:MAG: 3D domain-containing protein [Planctomycetes bacterium]|nr:3D domain-containing protein [Planctomycetota bacterium]